MPRPHPLPRRPPVSPGPFPPFDPVPPTRVLASINIRRDAKSLFDAMQMWLSYKEGRAMQQWEVFEVLFLAALADQDGGPFTGFKVDGP